MLESNICINNIRSAATSQVRVTMLYSDKIKPTKYFQKVVLLFITVLFVLGVMAVPNIAVANPDGYNNAKVELSRLMQDSKRGKYRHNWLSLADEMYEIYRNNADWNNRGAALYRSAKALDQMARRSYVRKDAQLAASRYELLVKNHPIIPLADDALYAAASIYQEVLHDTNKSRALLNIIGKKYAKSDHAQKAKVYLSELNGNIVASLGTTPTSLPRTPTVALTEISPQLRNDVVRIILSMESIVSWRAKYFKNASGDRPGVIITLKDVKPSKKIDLEDNFRKSGIFTGYDVKYDPSTAQSTVVLQFSDLLRYTVKSERSPARLIIEATNSKKALPAGIVVRDEKRKIAKTAVNSSRSKNVAKKKDVAHSSIPTVKITKGDIPNITTNIASQLGLRVRTIVIDPGHGGRDSGSVHNGLCEKDVNLDISKRLANVLRGVGYEVFLTRTDDRYLGLYERTDIARKYKADLFVSIHANANTKTTVTGFETYYLDFSEDLKVIALAALENANLERRSLGEMEKILGEMLLKARIQESKKLAKIVQHNALKKTGRDGYKVKNGGARGAPFHVLIGSSMPAVLVEVGYSSNKEEAKLLTKGKYRNSLAEGIANGLHQYSTQLLRASR